MRCWRKRCPGMLRAISGRPRQFQLVRDARAAGEVALVRPLRRCRHAARELPPSCVHRFSKPISTASGGELQRFIPIPRGSPVKAFNALPGTSQLVDGSPCRAGFRNYIGISMILSIAKLGLTCLKSNTEGMPPDSAASSLPTPFWCPEFRCRTVRRNPYKALLSRDYSAMER